MKPEKTKIKESELLRFASRALDSSGLLWWRMPIGGVAQKVGNRVIFKKSPIKGFPDLAGLMLDGKFFAIELKTDSGRLTPEQKAWIFRINTCGGIAVVLRSKEEISQFVAAALEKGNYYKPFV